MKALRSAQENRKSLSETDLPLGNLAFGEALRYARVSTRNFQEQFHHRDGGPERLQGLIFVKSPGSWRLQP